LFTQNLILNDHKKSIKIYPQSGGQFEPVGTGQFEPVRDGQFQPARGGQFQPVFAIVTQVCTNSRLSEKVAFLYTHSFVFIIQKIIPKPN
jgi:hypothetical protein